MCVGIHTPDHIHCLLFVHLVTKTLECLDKLVLVDALALVLIKDVEQLHDLPLDVLYDVLRQLSDSLFDAKLSAFKVQRELVDAEEAIIVDVYRVEYTI